MPEKSKRPRRSFSAELKQTAVDPVVQQGYSFKAAADAVSVAVKSLRDWHAKPGLGSPNRAVTTPRRWSVQLLLRRRIAKA